MKVDKELNNHDNDLFQEFLDGNKQLFNYFFDKYYGGLCVYAFRMIQSKAFAEDLVQDIFVKIWENRQKISIRTHVKSYLLRSVHNRCLDFIAHQNVKADFKSSQLRFFTEEMLIEYPLMDFQLAARIEEAIRALPPGIRESFELNRLEDLSYRQVAEKQGISIKTVEYRISKALLFLRKQLKEYLPLLLFFFSYCFFSLIGKKSLVSG